MVAPSHPLRLPAADEAPSGGPQHIGEILPALLASYAHRVAEHRPPARGGDPPADAFVSRLSQALVA